MSSTSAILDAPCLTEILVVRHAEVHNPQDIVYGRLPRFRLSQTGVRQAERIADFVAQRPVAAIYSSPLLRARQTSSIVAARLGMPGIRTSRLLLETKTGYQGSPGTILKPGFSFYEPRQHEGDETMLDVLERMLRFLRRAARRHRGQLVMAVSHADPIAILRLGLEGKDLSVANMHGSLYPARASVSQITLTPDRPLALTYFNVAEVQEVKL